MPERVAALCGSDAALDDLNDLGFGDVVARLELFEDLRIVTQTAVGFDERIERDRCLDLAEAALADLLGLVGEIFAQRRHTAFGPVELDVAQTALRVDLILIGHREAVAAAGSSQKDNDGQRGQG